MRTRGSLRSGPSHSSLPLLLSILIRLKPSHHRDRIGPSISAVRRRLLFSEGEGGRRRVRSCGYVSLALSQVNLNLISFIVVRVRTPLPPHPIRDERNSDSRVLFLLCGPLCAPEGRSEKLTFCVRFPFVRSFVDGGVRVRIRCFPRWCHGMLSTIVAPSPESCARTPAPVVARHWHPHGHSLLVLVACLLSQSFNATAPDLTPTI